MPSFIPKRSQTERELRAIGRGAGKQTCRAGVRLPAPVFADCDSTGRIGGSHSRHDDSTR